MNNIEEFSKNLWSNLKVFKVELNKNKEKEIILDFFPYPSGHGLHIGHILNYTATDIYARFQRAQNKNVLYSIGFDAFGLPAEQFAFENKIHPSIITNSNISNMTKQLKYLGFSYDWEKSFSTTEPSYYKWTQWIFLQMFNSYFDENEQKAKPISVLEESLKNKNLSNEEIQKILNENRLAYLDEIEVNWCAGLGTVLANEEIINGLSERGNFPIVKKKLKQWMLRITKYAPRLVENLSLLDWPDSIKEMQKNWVNISKGHLVSFQIYKSTTNETIEVYTTRIETINAVSFIAISKNHPLAQKFNISEETFAPVFINKYAMWQEKIVPIYIVDYVLDYATCAVMGVPAHDQRDYLLAKKLKLSFAPALVPNKEFLENLKITKEEYYQNAPQFPPYVTKDLENKIFKKEHSAKKEIEILEQNSLVKKTLQCKLKDWIFSRQRYWGEPFPIVFDENQMPYAIESLPVELPDMEFDQLEKKSFEMDEIKIPLDHLTNWKFVKFIKLNNHFAKIVQTDEKELVYNGKTYFVHSGTRETNTMPNWAGSCWYYLRYIDNLNDKEIFNQELKNYWLTAKKNGSVDLYVGGAEHAVLHLLYARFWHFVLFDLGIVNSPEPFQKLFNQGMILGSIYQNFEGKYFSYLDVKVENNEYYSISTNEKLTQSFGKIGKRYKNGISPEEMCEKHGIDAVRLHMMYLGPLEQNKPLNFESISGMKKFLANVENLKIVNENEIEDKKIFVHFNSMLNKVAQDIRELKYNTAISNMIIFVNKYKLVSQEIYKRFLIVLNPLAPHLAEFLYQKNVVEKKESIQLELWPKCFETDYKINETTIVIQINGKKHEEIKLQEILQKEDVENFAKNYALKNNLQVKKQVIIQKAFCLINFIV